MKCTGILLAAGRSTRMGTNKLKGLLPWNGTTLFAHQLQMMGKSALSEIIAVVGYKAERFLQIAKPYPAKAIINKNYQKGKCSSILTGLYAIDKKTDMILIAAVDQPLDSSVINQLIEALQTNSYLIAIPAYNGKRGHPILFSAKLLDDLLAINEDTKGLHNVIKTYKHMILEVPIDNPLITLNVNTPEDYERAINSKLEI